MVTCNSVMKQFTVDQFSSYLYLVYHKFLQMYNKLIKHHRKHVSKIEFFTFVNLLHSVSLRSKQLPNNYNRKRCRLLNVDVLYTSKCVM